MHTQSEAHKNGACSSWRVARYLHRNNTPNRLRQGNVGCLHTGGDHGRMEQLPGDAIYFHLCIGTERTHEVCME